MTRTYQATTKKIDECRYENTITLGTKHTYSKDDVLELQIVFQDIWYIDTPNEPNPDFIQ